jgi:3-dehydroquinate synthase
MIEGADDDRVHRVRDAVALAGLPTAIRKMPRIEALIAAMKHDKKTRGGVLRIVVPSEAFIARTVENPPEAVLRAGFAAIQGT